MFFQDVPNSMHYFNEVRDIVVNAPDKTKAATVP